MSEKIFYLCDGEVPECTKTHCYKNTDICPCKRTSDISHAKNFEKTRGGYYREKENGKTWEDEILEAEQKFAGTNSKSEENALENKKAYRIEKLYADTDINDDDKKGLIEARLEVSLRACDWYKFQSQAFYQEMLRYLDNVKIQKTPFSLVQERSSAES